MRASKLVVTLAVAAFLAAPALAQFGPRGGGGAGMMLINKGVQKELKLTDEQITKIDDFSKKNREKMQEAFQGGDREKAQEVMKEIATETEKFVKDTLKPDQTKRLKQIERQQGGTRVFNDEEVAKALKLTDEQKDDIKKLNEDVQKEVGEAFQGAFGDQEKMAEARKKMATLNKEAMEKVNKMLTTEQKTAWKDLLGEAFDYKQEGGFGRGGDFGKGGKGGKGGKKKQDQ